MNAIYYGGWIVGWTPRIFCVLTGAQYKTHTELSEITPRIVCRIKENSLENSREDGCFDPIQHHSFLSYFIVQIYYYLNHCKSQPLDDKPTFYFGLAIAFLLSYYLIQLICTFENVIRWFN